jgi:hypothetical protein
VIQADSSIVVMTKAPSGAFYKCWLGFFIATGGSRAVPLLGRCWGAFVQLQFSVGV